MCIKRILQLYRDGNKPKSVILVGHSMVGFSYVYKENPQAV